MPGFFQFQITLSALLINFLDKFKDKEKIAILLFLSGDTFANRLDPDQDRQNVGPDLDPNCLTL